MAFRLRGNATTTNADAIGARVSVRLAAETAKPLIKTLRAGEGFLGQSSKWIHFGLSKNEEVESVSVDWPGGREERFGSCAVNQRYELVQGIGEAKLVTTVHHDITLPSSTQNVEPARSAARIPLTTLTPMVDVQFADLRTNENRFLETDNTNQATLLVLWSGWCGTCIADLEELGRHANSLRDANIRVVALCIDRIVRPETQRSKLIAIADQLRLPFALGWASQSLVDQLQLLHDGFILMADPLPVPVSFLIDTEGLLSVIYKGRVQPDWLLADVTHGTLSRDQRFQAAAPIAGRTIDDPSVQKARETGELSTRLRLASAFQRSGYLDAAARHFFAAGQLSPLSSHAHFGLGDVFLRQNRLAEAVRELQRATTLSSTHAEAHFRLALALEKQQHYATAVSHYRQGLKLEPSFFEAANNLAWILATHASPAVRSGVEAVRLAEKCATATDYRDASVLDTLAAAYAEAGEFEKAAGIQAQAIELSPAAGRQRFIERRQRYLSGQPYRMAN